MYSSLNHIQILAWEIDTFTLVWSQFCKNMMTLEVCFSNHNKQQANPALKQFSVDSIKDGPKLINLSCSTQLSIKFVQLINLKISTDLSFFPVWLRWAWNLSFNYMLWCQKLLAFSIYYQDKFHFQHSWT